MIQRMAWSALLVSAFCSSQLFASNSEARVMTQSSPATTSSLSTSNARPTAASARTEWSLSAGVPDLISLRFQRAIRSRQAFGLQFGYVPVGLFASQLNEPQTSRLNERYDVVTSIEAHALSFGAFHQYRFTERFYLESHVGVLALNGGGTAYFTHRESKQSSAIGKVEVSVFQPLATASLGYSLYRGQSWRLDLGGGLSYRFPYTLSTNVSGAMPSLLEVAPEYRESVIDGRENLEKDLLTALSSFTEGFPVLPSVFIRGSW